MSPEVLPAEIHEIFAKATCLFSKAEVEAALDSMALEMNQRLAEKNPISFSHSLNWIPLPSLK